MIETAGHERIDVLADLLHQARRDRALLDATAYGTKLSLAEAYHVQEQLTRLRVAEDRRPVGYKLGYTSAAMRRQMGVDAPNYGPLLHDMVLPSPATAAGFLHPRVEPEIGIILGADLSGPNLMLHEVAEAVAEVRACLEIVDSIWRDYRFTAEQNTADGSSAAGVVLGPVLDIDPLRTHQLSVGLLHNDALQATATSAAASGHPLHSIAWLAAQLAARGRGLRKGELVITGGLTAAAPLLPGATISATFGRNTTVSVQRPATEADVDT